MNLLRTNWKGFGKWKVVADFMSLIGRLFNGIRGENGVEVRNEGLEIIISGSGGGAARFSGVAYVAGTRIENLNSDSASPWVRVNLYDGTAVQHSGPPPNPFPPGEEWYAKASTAGDIHVLRAG